MPLAAGQRVGPFEILAPLGAGGMGEVYSARDTRLGRTVAIKRTQQRFSDRFHREARAISSVVADVDLPASAMGLAGFSLHPDGTRFVTSLGLWPSQIWMLEGFDRH